MYIEATVIVDGALAETEVFDSTDPLVEEHVERWAMTVLREYREKGAEEARVYTLEHPHDLRDEECFCSQYLDDHQATWTLKDLDC